MRRHALPPPRTLVHWLLHARIARDGFSPVTAWCVGLVQAHGCRAGRGAGGRQKKLAEAESDTTAEESGDTDDEDGCSHSSAYITRSRSAQPIPSELASDDSGAGSGSDCDGRVFDEDGGYDQDEAAI